MNRAGVPAPGFIKRIGPIVDTRRETVFQELQTVELVNRLKSGPDGTGMPFGWTVNPFRGCEIGCTYCYARPTHEYLGHADPVEFESRVYVKRADPGRLLDALRRARASGQEVAIGTATDPYQPAEGRFRVTRDVLRAVAQVRGLRVGITTKGVAVTRDLELLQEIAAGSELTVNVSLISLDADLLRILEPRAARPDLRLGAMRTLAAAGIVTRLFLMPILPFITDGEHGLRDLLRAGREAGAREAVWNVLFLRGSARGFYLDVVKREFPWLSARYEALYARGTRAESEYREGIERLVERLARESGLAGLTREDRVRREAPARPRQLELAW
ncbi:MAG TPA: radical SAM protein [Candidatus Nitrosocosmicus sp.]|jgi:DNA repair photolyase|nr:radical SAM protein [Candidatus Nitrosocosmicus sp.]